jgi:hypothetical protein
MELQYSRKVLFDIRIIFFASYHFSTLFMMSLQNDGASRFRASFSMLLWNTFRLASGIVNRASLTT